MLDRLIDHFVRDSILHKLVPVNTVAHLFIESQRLHLSMSP